MIFVFVFFVHDKGTSKQFLDHSPGDTTAPYAHDTVVYERYVNMPIYLIYVLPNKYLSSCSYHILFFFIKIINANFEFDHHE